MERNRLPVNINKMKAGTFSVKKIFLFLSVLTAFTNISAQVKLPQLVRDSMVLQRDVPLKIWGWASPKEKVSIRFLNKNYTTRTGTDGKWLITLSPQKTGGPYTMDISGKNKITLKEILVGDVWFCSGQSNMVHQMNIHDVAYAKDIAEANFPEIRQFWIPTLTSLQGPKDDLQAGYWNAAIRENVRPFSAVAYFFALKVYEKYKVPIGIINSSVGGTPIEAWISEEGFKEFPEILKTIEKNKDTAYINGMARRAFANNSNRPVRQEQDKGVIEKWYDPSYIPKKWRPINIPGYWEDQGIRDLNGVVWYRKEVEVPASIAGKAAKVFLGRIVDADVLYINGRQVGNTTYQYPQRRYHVPEGILKAGKNIFVIKVTNNSGKGGFVPDKPYYLFSGKDTIDLKGYWQYKVGEVFIPRTGGFGGGGISAQNQPSALYNAMVAPLTNYSIKGILWYQGESNAGRPAEYANLLPALIHNWRSQWNQSDAPFICAQLPGFMDFNYLPTESNWAMLRESQLKSLSLSNTAITVNIDLGEWNDIHPDNKKDVGERMALAALKIAYGETIVHSGPIFQSSKIVQGTPTGEGNKIILSFTNTGSGLVAIDGEELSEFAIAGADKKFVWAKAKIVRGTPDGEGDKVIVWNDDVTDPMYVRYAWADNPVNPNLYNKEALPASPFRTDN